MEQPLSIIKTSSSRFGVHHHLHSKFALLSPGNSNTKCKSKVTRLHNKSFTPVVVRSFTRRNSGEKKLKKNNGERRRTQKNSNTNDSWDEEYTAILADTSSASPVGLNVISSHDTSALNNPTPSPSRSDVLKSCTVTSGFMFAFALAIRQVHAKPVYPTGTYQFSYSTRCTGRYTIFDIYVDSHYNFVVPVEVELWHLELILGLVLLISSCRYLLLRTWPDFAESSEAANQQVLSSLQPLDYIIVAFLPGISEEFLFRGALLPLFGLNWKSAAVVAAIFGLLHFGSGRKFSFVAWATFVGVAYGYATIVSSSILVPVVSHAFNNLVGGIMWNYMPKTSEEK